MTGWIKSKGIIGTIKNFVWSHDVDHGSKNFLIAKQGACRDVVPNVGKSFPTMKVKFVEREKPSPMGEDNLQLRVGFSQPMEILERECGYLRADENPRTGVLLSARP